MAAAPFNCAPMSDGVFQVSKDLSFFPRETQFPVLIYSLTHIICPLMLIFKCDDEDEFGMIVPETDEDNTKMSATMMISSVSSPVADEMLACLPTAEVTRQVTTNPLIALSDSKRFARLKTKRKYSDNATKKLTIDEVLDSVPGSLKKDVAPLGINATFEQANFKLGFNDTESKSNLGVKSRISLSPARCASNHGTRNLAVNYCDNSNEDEDDEETFAPAAKKKTPVVSGRKAKKNIYYGEDSEDEDDEETFAAAAKKKASVVSGRPATNKVVVEKLDSPTHEMKGQYPNFNSIVENVVGLKIATDDEGYAMMQYGELQRKSAGHLFSSIISDIIMLLLKPFIIVNVTKLLQPTMIMRMISLRL